MRILFAVLTLLMGVGGCTDFAQTTGPQNTEVHEVAQSCCRSVERYPDPIISILDPKAENAADRPYVFNREYVLRAPYLQDQPRAWEYVLDHLQPFDILLTSDKSQLAGRVVPGYFGHSLMYLGTEEQLKQRGLWEHAALRPHHPKIRAGQIFYEATPPKVRFSAVDMVLDVDAVAVFRPQVAPSEQSAALARLMTHFDRNFDARLDLGSCESVFCAELINLALPGLRLPQTRAYGRRLIVPDSIATHALDPETPLRFVGFVAGLPGRVESLSQEALIATIARYWPS
ncbi:MAG: hypothetical protein N4A61_04700 [Pelagimonas sp.]|nr:hypothetical protein [Pelagimonas sp.]